MLPDFHGLCKQSDNSTDSRSLKPVSGRGFSQPQSFHQKSQKCDRSTKEGHRTPKKKKKKRSKGGSKFIVETLSEFLALWPHRFDYIYAPHPDPGTKPEWQTESRHPLTDRLFLQGAYLYGVRPGSNTCYGLIDIDKGSPYHPQRDPMAIARIVEALEPLGLVTCLKLTSSDSKGLHIYFPFFEEVPSWQLALAVATLLEKAGFFLNKWIVRTILKDSQFAAWQQWVAPHRSVKAH